ncbi:MAG: serine O-acetyltransferase [Clostridia bacterium]|nr:serine O-acetyltransferase [Clostridia bacterium]
MDPRKLIKDKLNRIKTDLGAIRDSVLYDVHAFRERDPAAQSDAEVLLLYPGMHALLFHRAAHALHEKGYTFAARAISQGARFITGIEIHPAAKIGKGLVIDHGAAVVIGETAEIGNDCTIYQGVTLGGTGKDTGKRHPTIGNNVLIGAGAKVLGPFKVGDGARIAAGAVVLEEVPENSTAVGIPARVVRVRTRRDGSDDLDQIHIPDPVEQEICRMNKRIRELEKRLDEAEKEKDGK